MTWVLVVAIVWVVCAVATALLVARAIHVAEVRDAASRTRRTVAADEVGVDEVGVDEVGVDEVGVDSFGVDGFGADGEVADVPAPARTARLYSLPRPRQPIESTDPADDPDHERQFVPAREPGGPGDRRTGP